MLGDGESQEGLIWESALAASNFKADNLMAILDHNGMQSGGRCRRHLLPWETWPTSGGPSGGMCRSWTATISRPS